MRRFAHTQLSLPAFAWYALASVLSVPLAFIPEGASLTTLLGLGLAITAVTGVAAWLLWQLGRRMRVSGPGWTLIFFSQVVLVGLVRGIAFYELTPLFGLSEPTSLGFRLTNSVLITLIWLTLACAVVSGQRRYLAQYRSLVNQAVFTAARNDTGGLQTVEADDPTPDGLDQVENIVALKANLSAIHEQVAQAGVSEQSLSRAAASVRQEIEATLRPMSHRLWFNATEGKPQVRTWGLVMDAIAGLRFSITRVLLICLVPTFVGGVAFLPLGVNVLTVVISTAVLWGLLAGYREASKRRMLPLAASAIFLFAAGVLTYAVTYGVLLWTQPADAAPFSAMVWVVPLAVWIVVWADSAIILISQDRRTITQALRRDLFGSLMLSSSRAEQERLASYLHNSLQSELTGIAYQLEHSASTLDTAESRRSLEQLGALINRSISQDFANFSESPLRRITRITDAWSGIAQVSISIDDAIGEQDARLVLAVQVIEEGITNAVRHSGATHITATVLPAGENLLIELRSDHAVGVVAAGPTGTGVGTAWLERYSLEKHSLATVDGRSILTVEL